MVRPGWKDADADLSLIPNTSVGYMVKHDRNYVALAQTIGHEDDALPFASTTSIPRGCIISMTRIGQ